MVTYKINRNRLESRLEEMSKIGRYKEIGVHRLSLSDEDKEGRNLLKKWMLEAGMEVKVDKVGNMYGFRKGTDPSLSPVAFGSHLDSVGHGGRFDGSLGVLAGLETIETLNDADKLTRRPLVLMNYTNEEGTRFAPDMMGSMVVAGGVDIEDVYNARDLQNSEIRFEDELERIGYKGAEEPTEFRPDCFVELHIEQGPILEHENYQIGAVTGVQGIRWIEFILKGEANHAGTTPMHLRKDPGIVLGKVLTYIRKLTQENDGLVATSGMLETEPNVINVIPQQIRFSIDMRCPDKGILNQCKERLISFAEEQASDEGVILLANSLATIDPVVFNDEVIGAVEESSKDLNYQFKRMTSGAGHDAQLMCRVVPAAMIFIRSKGGISHSIHEYSSPEDVEAGANVLLNTVVRLAER